MLYDTRLGYHLKLNSVTASKTLMIHRSNDFSPKGKYAREIKSFPRVKFAVYSVPVPTVCVLYIMLLTFDLLYDAWATDVERLVKGSVRVSCVQKRHFLALVTSLHPALPVVDTEIVIQRDTLKTQVLKINIT